ncbi:MAG: hypothetical protein U0165_06965 [Polyangiaceae bacterium]
MTTSLVWVRKGLTVVGASALLLGTLNCDQLGGLGAATCPELSANVDVLRASISADARANAKIRAFIQASKDLASVSAQIEGIAAESCRRMGTDLGLTQAQMQPRNEAGGTASGACSAVAARIDGIMRAGVGVQVQVTPPQCQANVQAEAQCSGSCSATLSPGEIVARCEPGRLAGVCQGKCTGQCEGRCNGDCQGQCTARDGQGRCVGQCNGTCSGSCDATCHARCEGQWQAPRCEGSITGPSADAECNASCKAHAEASASCSAAVVVVRPNANNEMAMRLAATLQANLPALLHAQMALGGRMANSARVVAQVGGNLPSIVGNAGAHALACISAAAGVTASASARINVSVQASASVSGSAGVR